MGVGKRVGITVSVDKGVTVGVVVDVSLGPAQAISSRVEIEARIRGGNRTNLIG